MRSIFISIAILVVVITACSESPNSPIVDITCSDSEFLANARSILGDSCVLSAKDVASVWGEKIKCPGTGISQSALEEAARQNSEGHAWHLVYVMGKSIVEQESMNVFELNPEFRTENWATEKQESGYMLIDFTIRFQGSNPLFYNDSVSSLGSVYHIPKAQQVSEMVITIYKAFGIERMKKAVSRDFGGSFGFISTTKSDKYNIEIYFMPWDENLYIGKNLIDDYMSFIEMEGCLVAMK